MASLSRPLLLLIVVAAPQLMVHSSLADAPSAGDTLRVITYNVQFLPEPVSSLNERPDPEYRAAHIAKQVSKFDLIALQETFHDFHRRLIVEGVEAAWSCKPCLVASPTPEGFYTSGGCLVISKRAIVAQHSTVFVNYSKPSDFGIRADGYAAKGVVHARVQRSRSDPDDLLDVFATHLEARDDRLRPLQYVEVATFVKEHSSVDRPALLLGDLNTRGGADYRKDPESQYSRLMDLLADARSGLEWIDLWPHLHKESLGGTTEQQSASIGKRIDYILLSNPRPPQSGLEPLSVSVELYQDEKVTALSDHNAVVAELEWR